MLDTCQSTSLCASLVGPVAARALRVGARGTVCAVFERSFYVCLGNEWVCVGPESLGAGPLNVLCAPWSGGPATNAVLRTGDIARIESGTLLAGAVRISLASARAWHPDPPEEWSKASLARGLAAFNAALPATLPDEGLARLLRSAPDRGCPASSVVAAAQAPVQYLTHLLDAAAAGNMHAVDAQQIAPLVGLGPGLTPSGDDYLGGALVALALTGQTLLRDRIWRALEPELGARTSDISRAHLAAAAEGYGSAALHDLLNAILAGRIGAIAPAIAAVAAVGHCSGWDALAGAIAAVRSASPLPA